MSVDSCILVCYSSITQYNTIPKRARTRIEGNTVLDGHVTHGLPALLDHYIRYCIAVPNYSHGMVGMCTDFFFFFFFIFDECFLIANFFNNSIEIYHLLASLLIQTVLIWVFHLIKHSNFLIVAILLYSYALSLLAISLIVATFFSKAVVCLHITGRI